MALLQQYIGAVIQSVDPTRTSVAGTRDSVMLAVKKINDLFQGMLKVSKQICLACSLYIAVM